MPVTLIANEIIYDPAKRADARWFCAADRRITRLPLVLPSRRKIFAIDGLAATISFFGLVHINGNQTFDDYFAALKCRGRWSTLEAFANWLLLEFNAIVSKRELGANPSGFHMAGFGRCGVPEMWYMTNIISIGADLSYAPLRMYYEVSERLRVDRASQWDAAASDFTSLVGYVFANGDLPGFVSCWSHLSDMEQDAVKTGLATKAIMSDRGARLYCKMEGVSVLYKRLTSRKVVGKPIDVFEVGPNTIVKHIYR